MTNISPRIAIPPEIPTIDPQSFRMVTAKSKLLPNGQCSRPINILLDTVDSSSEGSCCREECDDFLLENEDLLASGRYDVGTLWETHNENKPSSGDVPLTNYGGCLDKTCPLSEVHSPEIIGLSPMGASRGDDAISSNECSDESCPLSGTLQSKGKQKKKSPTASERLLMSPLSHGNCSEKYCPLSATADQVLEQRFTNISPCGEKECPLGHSLVSNTGSWHLSNKPGISNDMARLREKYMTLLTSTYKSGTLRVQPRLTRRSEGDCDIELRQFRPFYDERLSPDRQTLFNYNTFNIRSTTRSVRENVRSYSPRRAVISVPSRRLSPPTAMVTDGRSNLDYRYSVRDSHYSPNRGTHQDDSSCFTRTHRSSYQSSPQSAHKYCDPRGKYSEDKSPYFSRKYQSDSRHKENRHLRHLEAYDPCGSIGVKIPISSRRGRSSKLEMTPLINFKPSRRMERDVKDIGAQLRKVIERLGEKEIKLDMMNEWRLFARILDRCFFVLYVSIIIVSLVTIFPHAS